MSQILISDPVNLREAMDFAEQAGCLDQFGRDLCRLLKTLTVGMTRDNDRIAHLSGDFAPHSLRFAIWDGEPSRGNLVLNGGWIYDGPGSPGDGSAPALSVNLSYVSGDKRPTHSWNVHT